MCNIRVTFPIFDSLSGAVFDVAAPRFAGGVQKVWLEGGGLRDEDGGGAERPAQQPHPPQLHPQQTHGQSGGHQVPEKVDKIYEN